LQGLRVLVVEDEPMIALELQDQLEDLGCVVVGTAARLDRAMQLARDVAFDVALLDVSLFDASSLPVAEAVASRKLPMIFATGYGRQGVPDAFTAPVLEKPFDELALSAALIEAVQPKS
jgi:CheY-like chemotaxis protein